MDAFLRCLVERIEIYYKDRSVNITSQPFFPAMRLFGYFVSDHYTSNPLQKNIETIDDIRKAKRNWRARTKSEHLRSPCGVLSKHGHKAIKRLQRDFGHSPEVRMKRMSFTTHPQRTILPLRMQNRFCEDSSGNTLPSAKTASEVDEKTWASADP